MDHRLELERRGRDPAKIKELTLDNCRPADNLNGISEKLADFVNLEELRMINTGLSTLKGFPRLLQLKKLDISDNRLIGGLNYIAEACPNLCALNMAGNRIKDLDTLEPLKQLKSLKHLDMFNCDINTLEDYRDKVFQYLPQLIDLDSFDRANQEVDPSDDDDDEEEEPDGNNSDEENRNGFGEDNDDSDLDSTDSDVSDEDEPVANGNIPINHQNGVVIPPIQPLEGADDYDGSSTESEDDSDAENDGEEDDDEEADLDDGSDDHPPSPPHARGIKRVRTDDEGEEENAEDGSPDLLR